MRQKSGFKNLLLEKKLAALADTLEKKEAQLNEVLSASNLDPSALSAVSRKLEVRLSATCSSRFTLKLPACCTAPQLISDWSFYRLAAVEIKAKLWGVGATFRLHLAGLYVLKALGCVHFRPRAAYT